jgi:hypothetical protein
MRFPQLLIYEGDSRLADLLRPTAETNRWTLRAPQTPATCLRILQRGGPAVLVLKVGPEPARRELPLLARVTWQFPDAAVVVVADQGGSALASVAWDLGARFVLFPPHVRDQLPGIVAGLMASVISQANQPS